MRRIRLDVSYDGTNYCGWQYQPGVPTVQGFLEGVLSGVTGEKVSVTGSGRTDSGVHAICQVAAFSTESKLSVVVLQRALNGLLPTDIRVVRVVEVSLDFHPIRDVLSKRYRYLIDDNIPLLPMMRGYSWSSGVGLDLGLMRAAGKYLLGEQDYASFQTSGSPKKTTVRRVIDVWIGRVGGGIFFPSLVCVEVEANGFLYNMMRTIVGTLVMLSRSGQPERMREIIDSCSRDCAGMTAPAHGLYLLKVRYGNDPDNGT
ncbi:MAG: tRNA pseudouridine(38-40) synthase TruA [Planctomycetaceae bacterium]|nr:tRNA pseudouridine(38-40) synthase TruA [Planctomycetaceae bacterium]